jgi:hypothetical protein
VVSKPQRIEVENINTPGRTTFVRAEKYLAMKAALLKVLPTRKPGLTQAEMGLAVLAHLPERLFPAGATALWWMKTTQLDLEAKKLVRRDTSSKPTRWNRV